MTVPLEGGGRRDITLGAFNSPESRIEYRRICELLIGNGGFYPVRGGTLTVAEVLVRYKRHAEEFYGEGSHLTHVKRTLRTVRELFADIPVSDFGPKALKDCQARWVSDGFVRKSINKMTGTVKKVWKWFHSEELIPVEYWQSLLSVEGLKKGRTAAKDKAPVRPAALADVKAVLPHLPRIPAAVVWLQVLTGARCGELLGMRPEHVDRAGETWTFNPPAHKGTWQGKTRSIQFGPEAQRLLAPFMLRAGDGFVFSPARSEEDRNADRSAERATPRWKSHLRRNVMKRAVDRERPPGERYKTSVLRRSIRRACTAAGVERFTPHQLRHLAAHIVREEFGIEYCRAVLGHTVASMTEHYSREVDRKLATEVALKLG